MLREVARWGAIGTAAWLLAAASPAVAADARGPGDDPAKGPARIDADPTVTGVAQVGSPLQGAAQWRGSEPVTPTWAWQRCTSLALDSCAPIPGAGTPAYVPVDADAGRLLRLKVTVSNDKGWAWAVSAATAAVAAAPPPPAPVVVAPVIVPPLRMMSPRPVVRVRGWLTPRGARVTALTVRAPRGARVTVRCRAGSCPRARWGHTASLVHVVPFERRLRAGTRLIVSVTRPGFIGKRTVLRVRRGRAPARVDRCLFPVAPEVRACPSS